MRYTEVDPKSSVRRKLPAQLTRSESPYLFMLTMQIMKDPKEMIAAVNEQLAARGVYGRVAYAESGQWIDFAMNAAVE